MLVALKVAIAPVLIIACTLVARRWGEAVGGWLLGLPLVSGPVSVLLLVERGPRFARHAAGGTLLGLAAVAAFCASYSLLAKRWAWWVALPSAMAVSATTAVLLVGLHPGFAWSAVIAFGILTVLALAMGAPRDATVRNKPRRRDLAMRVTIAGSLVYLVSTAAGLLGPEIAGLLAPLPLLSATMAASLHRSSGYRVAENLLRGALVGSWGGAAFFLVVGLMMAADTVIPTYAIATLAAVLVAVGASRAQASVAAHVLRPGQ